jgi:hypothetical protein
MAETTCTVTDTFGMIPLGICGQPAIDTIASACPEGHTESTPICAEHKELLVSSSVPLMCPSCAESGVREYLVVSA